MTAAKVVWPRGRVALAMLSLGLSAAFLVGGYELVRSASSSLFIGSWGAARVPYAMAVMPLALVAAIYLYGVLLSKFGPRRTLMITSGGCALLFLAVWVGIRAESPMAAAVLFVFRQIYIVVLVEQYWSLVNSTLDQAQARLVNGPILALSSAGAILGGVVVDQMAEEIGSGQLILAGALALVPAAILSGAAFLLAGEPKPSAAERGGRRGHLHLSVFAESRTLPYLAAVVVLAQVVSTALNLRFYGLLETEIAVADARTAYLGRFWMLVNGISLVGQFLVAPLVLRWIPIRGIHAAIPLVHVAAAAWLLGRPSLASGAVAFLLFKCVDYSVFRAAKEILYIPLSFDARYRAKQVIDAFGYRFSMGATGGLFSLATLLAGAIPGLVHAVVTLVAALTWGALAIPLTAPAGVSRRAEVATRQSTRSAPDDGDGS